MNKVTGLRRILNATRYSADGIAACFRTEAAFRQEALLALFLIPLGLWLGETAAEKALLAGSLLIVMIVEIVNSAIERVVDRISDERHQLSKEAKDMGSAAVFVALVLVGLVWGVILLS
jgi:diacylglycerol kinase (ATP)